METEAVRRRSSGVTPGVVVRSICRSCARRPAPCLSVLAFFVVVPLVALALMIFRPEDPLPPSADVLTLSGDARLFTALRAA